MLVKLCSKCGMHREAHEFYNDSSRVDGRCGQCKSCMDERARVWRGKNPQQWRDINNDAGRRHYARQGDEDMVQRDTNE